MRQQLEESVTASIVRWLRILLEDEEIDANDNFLDIGGYSMLAVELNSLLVEAYKVELDIKLLYENSLREVGTAIGEAGGSKVAASEIGVSP